MPLASNWPFIIALALILTSECYLIIGVSIFKADLKSPMRRVYMAACLCLAVWSSGFGTMTIVSQMAYVRLFWSIGFIASGLFFASWLHFLLYLANYKSPHQRRWIVFFYVSCAAMAVLCVLFGDLWFVSTPYGNEFVYNSVLFKIAIIYYCFPLAIMILLQAKWWQDSKLKRQRRQSLVFLVLTLVVAPPGLFFDLIRPAFLGEATVPLATVFVLFVALQLYYTMKSNKGFNATTEIAADIVFKYGTMPVLLLDNQNNIVLANNAAGGFWGKGIIGRNADEVIFSGKGDPNQSFFNYSFRNAVLEIKTNHGVRTCEALLEITQDKFGEELNKVLVVSDISEMRGALDQAREASRAKSEFLSRMSHEIRTPMNAIIGMTNIGLRADEIGRMRYCLSKIDDASAHLLSLINDILDMSKIEAGKLELVQEEFDFEKMVANIRDVIAVKAVEKRVNFLVYIDPRVPKSIIGDELRLSQVIANFLSNAVKFTPERGAIQLEINLDSSTDDECVINVEVSDTGIGIEDENLSRVFASFEQADGSITRHYGGTGLGLAISKSIVELMGGTIGVASEAGKGSRFYFTINAKHNGQAAKRPDYQKEPFINRRVLVVDDSRETLDYFDRLLSGLEMEYDLVGNGEDAVGAVCASVEAEVPYEIIFIDYLMKGMDGLETMRRIKNISDESVHIIMAPVSDWGLIEKDAFDAGIDRFIHKPLLNLDLFDVINEVVTGESQGAVLSKGYSQEAVRFKPCRILLAEDMPVNREVVLAMLEDTGLSIDCVENGREAVNAFMEKQDKYGLILMDIQMPEMDGIKATKRIRGLNTSAAKSIPILAMTANAFKEDVDACLAAGMNGHIGKPVDFDELIGKLSDYLGRDTSMDDAQEDGDSMLA